MITDNKVTLKEDFSKWLVRCSIPNFICLSKPVSD